MIDKYLKRINAALEDILEAPKLIHASYNILCEFRQHYADVWTIRKPTSEDNALEDLREWLDEFDIAVCVWPGTVLRKLDEIEARHGIVRFPGNTDACDEQ